MTKQEFKELCEKKIVILDGYAANPGDLSWDAIAAQGDLTVYDRTAAEDVVARIGDEATVKRLHRRNGQIWLMPENDAFEPIDGTNAEIIGLVKAVYREY